MAYFLRKRYIKWKNHELTDALNLFFVPAKANPCKSHLMAKNLFSLQVQSLPDEPNQEGTIFSKFIAARIRTWGLCHLVGGFKPIEK